MKLPVTTETTVPSPETLWRWYSDVLFDHAVATGSEVELPHGRGVGRTAAPSTVIFPSSPADADVLAAVDEAFDRASVTRPSLVAPENAPIAEHLKKRGYVSRPRSLLRLQSAARAEPRNDGMLVLPVRAAASAIRRRLADIERDDALGPLYLGHLDDPQYDGFVAMAEGCAIGLAGLQSRGQIGLIGDVFVTAKMRRLGLARYLIARVAELASRAQLHHVFAAISSDDEAARQLAALVGFVVVMSFQEWTLPQDQSG